MGLLSQTCLVGLCLLITKVFPSRMTTVNTPLSSATSSSHGYSASSRLSVKFYHKNNCHPLILSLTSSSSSAKLIYSFSDISLTLHYVTHTSSFLFWVENCLNILIGIIGVASLPWEKECTKAYPMTFLRELVKCILVISKV